MEETPKQSAQQHVQWRPTQVYLLAGVCLLIGLPVGYLLRGSAPETTAAVASAPVAAMPAAPAAAPEGAAPTPASADMPHKMPTMEDMKHMADKKAEPLLTQLKSDPNNAQLLNKLGIVYRSAHQFSVAEEYFKKSLAVDPKNPDVRTDMAACMFYTGNVEGALSELDQALKYDPKHAGALMNIGIIELQAKKDAPAAVASWQKLLKLNPDFPQKAQVEQMIAMAKQGNKG